MNSENIDPDFDPFATEKESKSRRGGTGIALLALMIALVVAAFNGWQWWQTRIGNDFEASLAGDVNTVQRQQQSIRGTLDDQASRLAALEGSNTSSELEALRSRVDRVAGDSTADLQRLATIEETIEAYRLRLAELDAGLAAVVVRGESANETMELAEVEYLLRTANERLMLFGDKRAADRALHLADEQLASLDDPVYLPVRQAISGARRSLDTAGDIDHLALTQDLAALQSDILTLPFVDDVSVVEEEQEEAGEDTGWWQQLKNTLSGLVTVRRTVDEDAVLSLADQEYVRQSLWLQLETATLALMREDAALYRQALQRAEQTLERYFATRHASVTKAIETLQELSQANLEVTVPDISAPWQQLSRLRHPTPRVAPAGAEPEVSAEAEAETEVEPLDDDEAGADS